MTKHHSFKGDRNLPPTKERGFDLSMGWQAEPVNLLSNISFLLAAVIASQFSVSTTDNLLVAQVLAIAIFSSIAHIYVTRFTAIVDEIAICVFVVSYVAVFLLEMLGLSLWMSIAWFALFIFVGYLCLIRFRHKWNGAIDFVPVLLALWFGGFWLGYAYDIWSMTVSATLATVAVIARAADFEVEIPVGTHFLWHILSGWLLLNLLLTKFIHFPG